ncbi:MAG: ribonuclease HI, partial [Streptomyces sp.]
LHGALRIPEPRPERMTASPAARPRKSSTARTGKGSSGGVIKAKFPGRCHCQKSYDAGEKITKNAHGWGHVECKDS